MNKCRIPEDGELFRHGTRFHIERCRRRDFGMEIGLAVTLAQSDPLGTQEQGQA
jgi:hypothetical protein